MQRVKSATTLVLALFAALAFLAPAAPRAQLTIMESGFDVTDLGSSVGAKGIECSPGGVWGDYIYVADSGGNVLERIDYFDIASLFATLASGSFPVGLAFGPGPGSNFGDFLYVCNFGTSVVEKVDPSGTVFPFASITGPGDCVFDPSGAYGDELFVVSAYSGPIYKVDEFGTATSWSTVPSLYMKFGPGGAWGTGMYATSQSAVGIVTIDMAGAATNFATGFTSPEGFDWAYGTGFDGDMFASDVTTGEVWRIQSDGTKTLWATMPSAADVTFCNGALYLVGWHTGECFKVTPEGPVTVAFTDVRAAGRDGDVRVTWDVFADEDYTGFVVYREEAGTGSELDAASGLLDRARREWVDASVAPGETYRYVVGAQLPGGREVRSSAATVTLARTALSMSNYPNPFNPATTIEYALPGTADVTLGVYDSAGRLVVVLESGVRSAGTHQVDWDGHDATGGRAASGVYFYRLRAGDHSLTKKLVLLK
jgi:hypothetical protein